MELSEQNQPSAPQPGFFQSSTAKIIMVGLLTLVLLIPLEFVKSLIYERSERQKSVVDEINQKWGDSLYFYGPVLKVPYTTYSQTEIVDDKTKKVTYSRYASTEYAYFFPEELNGNINADTEKRKRANYSSVVYKTKMNFSGNYAYPDFRKVVPEGNIQWDKATVIVRTDSNRSINGMVTMTSAAKNIHLSLQRSPKGRPPWPCLKPLNSM